MKLNKVNELINADEISKKLEEASKLRNDQKVALNIEKLLSRVPDMNKDVSAMLNSGAKQGQIYRYISETLYVTFKDDLLVTNYKQKRKAQQEVYVYTGDAWRKLAPQQYVDLVKAALEKGGMEPSWYNDHTVGNHLAEKLAYAISRHINNQPFDSMIRLNMQNGLLLIDKEGNVTLRDHRKEDYLFYCIEYNYDPEAECPRFEAFLNEVLPDTDTQRTIAEYLGYCITRDIKAEKILLMWGTGSNGKSVLLEIIKNVFSQALVSNVPLNELSFNENRRLEIEHKLINISYENKGKWDPTVIKTLSSGEPESVKKLYEDARTMEDYAKIIASFNTLPNLEDTYAFVRRLILVYFNVTITEDKVDLDYIYKLLPELPGILNWILRALKNVLESRSIYISDECKSNLAEYRASEDSVTIFVEECCEYTEKSNTPGQILMKRYVNFCKSNKMQQEGRNVFYKRISTLEGVRIEKTRKGKEFNLQIIS